MIYEFILSASHRLDAQIKAIKGKIATYPDGNFFCSHDGKRVKWFYMKNKKEIYIPKKNRYLAEQLATKKYLSLLLKDYEQEKIALDFYLRHHNNSDGKNALNLLLKPEYQELISPHFQPLSQELIQWMNEPYSKNPFFPEHLIHHASHGNKVRSKSEAIICQSLTSNNIPFRYEASINLGGHTYYPDFTIRHPATGETYYWEHLGRMDEPDYIFKNTTRLKHYIDNNIYPGDKLIITYEEKGRPLSIEHIQKTIEYYFF